MHLVQLSEKLRLLCARFELTQEHLGQELGIAHTTVGRWLAGTSRPYDRHARKLAEKYGLKPEELLDDTVPLPARITDGRENILKRAAELAGKRHPNNQEAAQELFEAETTAELLKTNASDAAARLRTFAAELIALANTLEKPFEKPGRRRSKAGPMVEVTLPSQTQTLSTETGLPIPNPSRHVRSA